MRRMILSENVFDEKIFLFFALLGNSIPHVVRLSGRRRTVPNEKGREGLYLWRKDRTCENDSLTKAVELEKEAVFGRLEEPLIVAPHLEARRGNSHHGKMPAVIFPGKRLISRIKKVLEDANIELSSVVSDIMGMTGQAILMALVAGQEDPEYLSHLARGSLVKKEDQLQAALQGKLFPHHRIVLEELLPLIASLDRSMARFDREVAERLRRFDALMARIDAVTGLSRRSIEVLFGELGWDMSRFPDAAHAASWVGICPGQHETGGKQLSGRTRQGNRWAKTVLIQAAHAAGHTQTYLGEQYRRISARRGSKKAAMAVGHSILVIFYHMVKTGEPYHEKGADYFTNVTKEKIQRRLVRQLERLGNTVILQPKAETTLARALPTS